MREIIEALMQPVTNMAAIPLLVVLGIALVAAAYFATSAIVGLIRYWVENDEYPELMHPRHDPLRRR